MGPIDLFQGPIQVHPNLQVHGRVWTENCPSVGSWHVYELRRQPHPPLHLDCHEEESFLPKSPGDGDLAAGERRSSNFGHQEAVCGQEERGKWPYRFLRTRAGGPVQS